MVFLQLVQYLGIRMRQIFKSMPNQVIADGKIILFKWSPVAANGTFNTVYMTNHMDRQLLHMRNIRKYVFMTMQYR